MSRTHLDLLFQVTPPVGERTPYSMPRIDAARPDFGDHLSQASTTTGGTTTASRSSDRSAANDASSQDRDSPPTEPPSSAGAASETATGDRYDAEAEESPGVEESRAAEATDSNSNSASVVNDAEDDEHDTEEETAHGEETIVAVAEIGNKITTAISTDSGSFTSAASDELTAGAGASDGPSKIAPSAHIAAAELTTEDAINADAPADTPTAATVGTLRDPAVLGESVDQSALSESNRKQRGATRNSTTEIEQQAPRDQRLETVTGSIEQSDDAALQTDAVTAKSDPASVDAALSVLEARSEGDTRSDESSDANARPSVRQRTDAVAIAVGAATQTIDGTSPREASDGATKTRSTAAAKVDAAHDGSLRAQANAGSSKRSTRADGADEAPRVDPARFVGRVAKAFHTAQERGGTLQLRLSPPELGAMRLEITVNEGVMTASLETETASARRVLLEHLPALRDRLAEQNIRVERFDIDVRRDGSGGQPDPRAAQDEQQPQQGHADQRRRQPAQPQAANTARQTMPANPARTNDHGINLVA